MVTCVLSCENDAVLFYSMKAEGVEGGAVTIIRGMAGVRTLERRWLEGSPSGHTGAKHAGICDPTR